MKIIYLANARIPTEKAHGYQICKMCEEFASGGAEVSLWVPSRHNDIKDDIFTYYEIKNNFTVKKLLIYNFFIVGKLSGRLEFWLRNYSFFVNLLFKKIPKDTIIYTRTPEIALIFGLKGNFVVLESHSWPKYAGWLHSFFIRRAGAIVAVTRFLKEKFEKSGFNSNKILVAPDGVDLERFVLNISKAEACTKLNLPLDKKLIGYTGSFKTMEMDKGISTILDGLKIILQQDNNVLFVAVGGKDADIKYYERQAENLGVKSNVIFIKKVPIGELAIYQKAFDIILMPFPDNEHYRYYMSPLKMFEYMASGRPIIASDLPSIREILNENNAVFIKPQDPEGFALMAQKILIDPGFYDKISKRAFQDAQVYDWSQRAKNIVSFIVNRKKLESFLI